MVVDYFQCSGRVLEVEPVPIKQAVSRQDRDLFSVDRRAQWGTKEMSHAADTPVYYGRINEFAIEIPSFRDDNN